MSNPYLPDYDNQYNQYAPDYNDQCSDRYRYLDEDHGSIRFVTIPTRSDIYIDGHLQSQHTETTITNISTGQHTITFIKAGYAPYTQTINVTKNQTITVSVTLAPNVGKISTLTNPSGASVYLDGVLQTQTTPSLITNVSVGQHTITFTKTGYASYTQTINVLYNQTTTISVTLIQNAGNILAITDPSGADIYIDGILQIQNTSSIINLPAGSHTITFTKAGYAPYTQIVNVLSNQTINISAILESISTIITGGIVICTTSSTLSCPVSPILCPIQVSPLDYVNMVAVISSSTSYSTVVRFTYIIDDTIYHVDINANLTPGDNIIYAWPTNRTFPPNTVVTLISATFISSAGGGTGDGGEVEECHADEEDDSHHGDECHHREHESDGYYDDHHPHHRQHDD